MVVGMHPSALHSDAPSMVCSTDWEWMIGTDGGETGGFQKRSFAGEKMWSISHQRSFIGKACDQYPVKERI